MGSDNLIPANKRTKEEVREMTSRGGRKSGESRRRKKKMREWLELALATKMKDKGGKPILSPDTGKPLTREEAGMIKLASMFANGDLRSIQLAAELLGERTVKAEVTGKDGEPLLSSKPMTIDEARQMMKELEDDCMTQ